MPSGNPTMGQLERTPGWLAYLQLFRLPNVFTAIADVLMGYLLVHRVLEPSDTFPLLLLVQLTLSPIL